MAYRDPETGRFITFEEWERLQEAHIEVEEDFEPELENWEQFEEVEVY